MFTSQYRRTTAKLNDLNRNEVNMIKYWASDVYLTSEIPDLALSWRNDPLVYRWCRQYTLISPTAHYEWLKKIEVDPTIKMFGIKTGMGQEVGVCGLTSINYINRSAEFSLYIAPEHHRKGFGKQALELLLAHGFWAFNLHKIWGETFDDNPAGEMFINMGMTVEGVLRDSYFRDGGYINSTLFSMLDSEFNDRYKSKNFVENRGFEVHKGPAFKV